MLASTATKIDTARAAPRPTCKALRCRLRRNVTCSSGLSVPPKWRRTAHSSASAQRLAGREATAQRSARRRRARAVLDRERLDDVAQAGVGQGVGLAASARARAQEASLLEGHQRVGGRLARPGRARVEIFGDDLAPLGRRPQRQARDPPARLGRHTLEEQGRQHGGAAAALELAHGREAQVDDGARDQLQIERPAAPIPAQIGRHGAREALFEERARLDGRALEDLRDLVLREARQRHPGAR